MYPSVETSMYFIIGALLILRSRGSDKVKHHLTNTLEHTITDTSCARLAKESNCSEEFKKILRKRWRYVYLNWCPVEGMNDTDIVFDTIMSLVNAPELTAEKVVAVITDTFKDDDSKAFPLFLRTLNNMCPADSFLALAEDVQEKQTANEQIYLQLCSAAKWAFDFRNEYMKPVF
jgi:hypothetical protein